jgi:hypothetical protein
MRTPILGWSASMVVYQGWVLNQEAHSLDTQARLTSLHNLQTVPATTARIPGIVFGVGLKQFIAWVLTSRTHK